MYIIYYTYCCLCAEYYNTIIPSPLSAKRDNSRQLAGGNARARNSEGIIHDNRTNLYTNGACYPSNANSFICNKITYFLELHKPLNGHRSMVFGRWCVNRKRGSDLSPFSVFST